MSELRPNSLLLIIVAAVIFVFIQEVCADVTRSCTATYNACPAGGGACWTFDFTGSGTAGHYAPNKARRRARTNIDECIDSHWRNYTATRRPTECTSANQISRYPVRSLIVDMTQNLCRLNPGSSSMNVSINVTYRGRKGCTLRNNSWLRNIAQNHTINCPAAEFEPNTDRPGGDFRNLFLDAPDPNLCRTECVRDDRCRAWTYVNPGVQGRQAKCWLKNRVPAARANRNCTSGVLTPM